MKPFGFIRLVVVLAVLFAVEVVSGEENISEVLLKFKSSIQSNSLSFLASWNVRELPCSSWKGVVCDQGRVVALNLTGARLSGKLQLHHLLPLVNLRGLYLRGNYFSGDLSLGKVSLPCYFDTVDLSSNNFSESLSSSFSLFSLCDRLVSVNLSRNLIPGGSFTFGPSLQQLDLSRNRISDYHLFNYSLSSCQNLHLLNVSDNKLKGTLPPFSCRNLSTFDVSYNQFFGQIPFKFVSSVAKHLDLSNNNFTGKFSSVQFNECGNLTVLNLSHNDLSGIDFPSTLSNCRVLEVLDVSHNTLQKSIPMVLRELKSLKHLSLAKNQFSGEIPPELADTCGTLTELDISGNILSGGFPETFTSCSGIQSLNLGNNMLSGDFLNSVVSTLSSLRYLYVAYNNITGSIPKSLTKCAQLQVLDLSSNGFTGDVPSWLCSETLYSLQKILLPGNFLSGSVPMEFGMCKNLRTLDLSFNTLSGSIPAEVWQLPNLSELVMWANNLTGEIPETVCVNGGNLQTLILNNNFITGMLPASLSECTNLIWVSLSNNKLTGEIPASIGKLKSLAILQLGNNSLTGRVPSELGQCQSLIWLDLNSNNLSESIPEVLSSSSGLVTPGLVSGKHFAFVRNEGGTACRGAGGLVEFEGIRRSRLADFPMVHVCPSTRIYTGMTVYTFVANGSLIYLDLSYNSLSGNIPDTLGSMSYLQVLNLGHNSLTGPIPNSFEGLKQIGVLDLSYNDLEGYIPGSLGTLTFLSDLDVSNNNLSGPIPSGGQLTTFLSSRYENNSGLCGVPLPACSSSAGLRQKNSRGKNSSIASGVTIGIILALCFILGLLVALYRMKRSQSKEVKRDKYIDSLPTSGGSSWKLSGVLEPLSINIATFEKPLRKLTFAHLLEATNGFSADSLIGSGGFGDVYKAQLKDGCVVAIKKLIHVTSQGEREFTAEMETIGKIKHRNLVPLLGYCRIGEERLLVYEYMKWGSLETVLHDKVTLGMSSKLNWIARKKMAIGSARGLAFLHHSCIPHIIHRDMKSSNVLLDENLEARVSDFGMARLMNAVDTHLSVSTLAGTPGYVPPEYYQSFRCTTKGDVYSYGVILLELISGHRPIDPSVFGDENNLVGWAKQLHKDKRTNEILDAELVEQESSSVVELCQYLKIAFECLDDRPFRRPTMIQVMTMFKELQNDSDVDILDGFSLKDVVIDESREKDP